VPRLFLWFSHSLLRKVCSPFASLPHMLNPSAQGGTFSVKWTYPPGATHLFRPCSVCSVMWNLRNTCTNA
jgi:hypothetical protein